MKSLAQLTNLDETGFNPGTQLFVARHQVQIHDDPHNGEAAHKPITAKDKSRAADQNDEEDVARYDSEPRIVPTVDQMMKDAQYEFDKIFGGRKSGVFEPNVVARAVRESQERIAENYNEIDEVHTIFLRVIQQITYSLTSVQNHAILSNLNYATIEQPDAPMGPVRAVLKDDGNDFIKQFERITTKYMASGEFPVHDRLVSPIIDKYYKKNKEVSAVALPWHLKSRLADTLTSFQDDSVSSGFTSDGFSMELIKKTMDLHCDIFIKSYKLIFPIFLKKFPMHSETIRNFVVSAFAKTQKIKSKVDSKT